MARNPAVVALLALIIFLWLVPGVVADVALLKERLHRLEIYYVGHQKLQPGAEGSELRAHQE